MSQDAGQHFSDLKRQTFISWIITKGEKVAGKTYALCFGVTGDGESVGLQGSLSAWVVEVDDSCVVLENVDFFDSLDRVHSEFL